MITTDDIKGRIREKTEAWLAGQDRSSARMRAFRAAMGAEMIVAIERLGVVLVDANEGVKLMHGEGSSRKREERISFARVLWLNVHGVPVSKDASWVGDWRWCVEISGVLTGKPGKGWQQCGSPRTAAELQDCVLVACGLAGIA
jgi:hypothetical protein